jgi:hypothetical protein
MAPFFIGFAPVWTGFVASMWMAAQGLPNLALS